MVKLEVMGFIQEISKVFKPVAKVLTRWARESQLEEI